MAKKTKKQVKKKVSVKKTSKAKKEPKEIKKAYKTEKKQKSLQLELGSIVTGAFYEFQEMRKGTYNRIRNVVFRKATGLEFRELQDKKKKTDKEKEYLQLFADKELIKRSKELHDKKKITNEENEYLKRMFDLLDDIHKKENQYLKLVTEFVEQDEIYEEFGQHIKGIGPLMSAMLLYYFGHCEKAAYPSSLWAFAGLTPDSKHEKGKSSGFNKNCRMFMWRIGDSFVKQRTPRYRPIYDNEKARQLKLMENEADNAPQSKMHAELRSRRKMVKYFLVDYYVMCKTIEKQPMSEIYSVAKLGHKHFDDIRVYMNTLKTTEGVKL